MTSNTPNAHVPVPDEKAILGLIEQVGCIAMQANEIGFPVEANLISIIVSALRSRDKRIISLAFLAVSQVYEAVNVGESNGVRYGVVRGRKAAREMSHVGLLEN